MDDSNTGNDPSGFLAELLGGRVVVKLNTGVEYKGIISAIDGFMHCSLEDASEWVQGVKRKQLNDVFIRGNNVLYISAD